VRSAVAIPDSSNIKWPDRADPEWHNVSFEEHVMNRYRVLIVPRTGRYAPVLTVLVDADSPDEAFETAQAQRASSKVISAENVKDPQERSGLRLLALAPDPDLPRRLRVRSW
jgi:hypothetical protein